MRVKVVMSDGSKYILNVDDQRLDTLIQTISNSPWWKLPSGIISLQVSQITQIGKYDQY